MAQPDCIDALPELKYSELATARKGRAKAGGDTSIVPSAFVNSLTMTASTFSSLSSATCSGLAPLACCATSRHTMLRGFVATTSADMSSIEKVATRILTIKKDGAPKLQLCELITQMSLLLITLR
jgi:hypothetical protein